MKKEKIRSLIAKCCYRSGLCALFYWLNRSAKRIITFHNVMPDLIMAGQPHVGCMESAGCFVAKLREIDKHFGYSVDLNDPKTVTLTFDDGLLNQYEVAGEILRKWNGGVPAIVFVAGNVIDATQDQSLITDKILLWCKCAPDAAVEKLFGYYDDREKLWVEKVQPAYREDGSNRGSKFLTLLESAYPISRIFETLSPEWIRLRMSGVKDTQIDDLRKRGWKIGWHTYSHYPLNFLSDEEKRKELDCPSEYRDVVLSYPYGDMGSIGTDSIRIAQELGYPCAVSNDPDMSPFRGQYFMQRLTLSADKYELHMVLSGLKYFIKYRKLLPKNCKSEQR